MNSKKKHEFLIIGSGAGGATLAKELSKQGKDVLVLERGEAKELPRKLEVITSKEGIDIYQAFGAGGSTVLSNGNGVRCLQDEFRTFNIILDEEFAEAEAEMGISPIDVSLLSENGSLKLLDICQKAGIKMERMPKFIDSTKCVKCGFCSSGCLHGAKWSAFEFLQEAISRGVKVEYDTHINNIIVKNGKAIGAAGIANGEEIQFFADKIILAAGGIESPIILQKSGIKDAGKNLSIDTCTLWYGVTPNIDISDEPTMQLVDTESLQEHGFILTTAYVKDQSRLKYYLGEKAKRFMNANWMSILIKIADDAVGNIDVNGTISKGLTNNDREKFRIASAKAKKILHLAGADDESMMELGRYYGGHNCSSTAIGKIVNQNLQTSIDNLFVCDAGVLPKAPALPPILTIVALAKWCAKQFK